MPTETAETLRDGRYVVVRVLGAGAQGETLDAVDKREGRPVAIKRFHIRGAKSWKDVELAEREARVLAGVSHPALPRYVEHFEENGALCLVMDKLEGESVASVLRRGGSFSPSDVARFLAQAADVLAYLHGRAPPVIHRDLKPGNVIYRPDGSFAFVDFGSVRDSLKPEGGSTVVGTFGYMAPEQFQGRALPASDVYAIGATALAMLTRRQPEDLPHKGLAIDVRAALGGQVRPELVDVLGSMLDPDPDRRASSIAALLPRLATGGAQPPQPGDPESGRTPEKPRSTGPVEGWGVFWDSQARADSGAPGDSARWERKADRVFHKLGRHAERAARKAERRAERHRRRFGYVAAQGPTPIPPIALVFAHFGLTVAEIVITVLFRVAAPVVLTLLSLVLGPNLRRAAARSSEVGARVAEAMAQARQALEQPPGERRPGTPDQPTAGGPARVAADERPARVRVVGEPETENREADVPRPVAHEQKAKGG